VLRAWRKRRAKSGARATAPAVSTTSRSWSKNESDIDAVLAALPADAFYGAQNLDDDSLLDLAPEGRRGRV